MPSVVSSYEEGVLLQPFELLTFLVSDPLTHNPVSNPIILLFHQTSHWNCLFGLLPVPHLGNGGIYLVTSPQKSHTAAGAHVNEISAFKKKEPSRRENSFSASTMKGTEDSHL